MKKKHTPLILIEVLGSATLRTPDGREVVHYRDPAPSNSDFIRFAHRACNVHDDLVKALEDVKTWIENHCALNETAAHYVEGTQAEYRAVCAALQKAGAQ